MCEYAYCRISKSNQRIERQIRNIKNEYPNAVIIEEAFTGTTIERKGWINLVKQVKEGDTIIFDSVSRMSRNAEEGFKAYEELFNRGINLIFIKEPQINTSTYKNALNSSIPMTGTNIDYILKGINQFLLELAKEQIKLAFIQSAKEVDDLHQRTKEGIATARLLGKQIGRAEGIKIETKKSKIAKEQIKKHSVSFGGSLSDIDVMKLTGLARNTYYKYKKEIKDEI